MLKGVSTKRKLSWAERARQWDIEYGLPRPADAQHLPSYQAFLRLLEDLGAAARSLLFGSLAGIIIYITSSYVLELHGQYLLLAVAVAALAILMGFVEASIRFVPYYRVNQRTSYGSTRWASADELQAAGQLHPAGQLPPGHIRIGGFGRERVVTLGGADEAHVSWLQHIALFGPPRSGKSKTFLMSAISDALRGGSSVVVLDPKGELYEHTAQHARENGVYRFDLQDPRSSDRWNFLSECIGSSEFAHQMAATIIGLEGTKQSVQDPFWPTSETAALTALLMYMAHEFSDQHPEAPMVYDLAALMPTEDLVKALENCSSYEVRTAWGAFTKAAQQTRDSILTGLMTNLHPFQIDAAREVMAYPTEEERRRGIRVINFADLRRPGTAIYIVIPEGDATRYKTVLTTFIGHVVTFLRRDGYKPSEDAPVLFVLDEAGNVPIVGLKELVGVGRGRGMGFYLGYQNISMVYDQYGRDGGDAILGAIATHIYLPGIDPVTAEAAVKRIGQTTVLSRSDIDASSDRYDQTRLQETGRPLIDASELRQLVPYRQAVVVMGTLPPVKITYPSMATVDNPLRPIAAGQPRPRRLHELRLREELLKALRIKVEEGVRGPAAGSVEKQEDVRGPAAGSVEKQEDVRGPAAGSVEKQEGMGTTLSPLRPEARSYTQRGGFFAHRDNYNKRPCLRRIIFRDEDGNEANVPLDISNDGASAGSSVTTSSTQDVGRPTAASRRVDMVHRASFADARMPDIMELLHGTEPRTGDLLRGEVGSGAQNQQSFGEERETPQSAGVASTQNTPTESGIVGADVVQSDSLETPVEQDGETGTEDRSGSVAATNASNAASVKEGLFSEDPAGITEENTTEEPVVKANGLTSTTDPARYLNWALGGTVQVRSYREGREDASEDFGQGQKTAA